MTFKTHHGRTVACAALCLTGFVGSAYAADAASDIPIREVSLAGLNLAKPADVERLYRRIAGAASQVCEPVGVVTLVVNLRAKKCVTEAIARAVGDIDAPALTRYYAMKTRQVEEKVVLSKATGGTP